MANSTLTLPKFMQHSSLGRTELLRTGYTPDSVQVKLLDHNNLITVVYFKELNAAPN